MTTKLLQSLRASQASRCRHDLGHCLLETGRHSFCIADLSATLPFDVVLGEVEAPAIEAQRDPLLPLPPPNICQFVQAGDEKHERADQAQPPVPTEAHSLLSCTWRKERCRGYGSDAFFPGGEWRSLGGRGDKDLQRGRRAEGRFRRRGGGDLEHNLSMHKRRRKRRTCRPGAHSKGGPHSTALPKAERFFPQAALRRERAWLRHLKRKRREEEPGPLTSPRYQKAKL